MAPSPKTQFPTHCDLLSLFHLLLQHEPDNLTPKPYLDLSQRAGRYWRHWRQWQLNNTRLSALEETLDGHPIYPCQATLLLSHTVVCPLLGAFTEERALRHPKFEVLRHCSMSYYLLCAHCLKPSTTPRIPTKYPLLSLRPLLLCLQWRCGEHHQLPGSRLVGTDPRLVAQRRGYTSG